ncbi:hypothetical protein [Peribacillus frigoritolerans]|uniref:hypothetical protein n=1 Tax=Peribacillus frigoritolerans TaxID=450367 RepID=UPI00227DA631|nr:hypothetical protein [Peribacillus frigoritolerans]MCY8938082.1 hypothetical protein [Peribacillus frigoritolerans]
MAVIVKDLFTETRKTVKQYKAKCKDLNKQESELKSELVALQAEHTANILSQETANLSERIYLNLQAKGLVDKASVINAMLEELEEKRTALKLQTVNSLQESLGKDNRVKAKYNANEIVDDYLYRMFAELTEIGGQMQSQYRAIAPSILEIYEDPKVAESFTATQLRFDADEYRLSYWQANKTVVHREHIRLAGGGHMPSEIRPPAKDVKLND